MRRRYPLKGREMTDRELMQQALDALETQERFWSAFRYEPHTDTQAAITALRDRLKQTEPGPVAWSYWQSCLNDDGTQTAPWVHRLSKFKPSESIINKEVVPLYTTPPQRKPLTDEEILDCTIAAERNFYNHMRSVRGQQLSQQDQLDWWIARAIEAAHGIKS